MNSGNRSHRFKVLRSMPAALAVSACFLSESNATNGSLFLPPEFAPVPLHWECTWGAAGTMAESRLDPGGLPIIPWKQCTFLLLSFRPEWWMWSPRQRPG